jgi:iron complex outermembrane receptor protein
MRPRLFALLSVILAFVFAPPLYPQGETRPAEKKSDSKADDEKAAEPVEPEVVVTAKRLLSSGVEPDTIPGNVSIITADDLARTGAASLPDALQRIGGVNVADITGFGTGGGMGALVDLRTAGGTKGHTLVLVDGVRLNTGADCAVLWSAIPIECVERVEVLRGGCSTLYGEGAMGGVINIITKKPQEGQVFKVSASAGNFARSTYGAYAGGQFDAFGYSVGFSRENQGGYREHSTYLGYTTYSKFTFAPDEFSTMGLSYRYHDSDNEFPSWLTVTEAKADPRQRGNAMYGEFFNRLSTVSFDADRKIGPDIVVAVKGWQQERVNDSTSNWTEFEINNPSFGGLLQVSCDAQWFHRDNLFILGVESDRHRVHAGAPGADSSHSKRDGFGVFVEDTLNILDCLSATAGYRFDDIAYDLELSAPAFEGDRNFRGHNPKFGVTFTPIEQVTLYGNWGKSFKTPPLFDMSAVIPPYQANTGMDPQQSTELEFGLRARHDGHNWNISGKLAWFDIRIRDEILYNPTTWQNENFDTSRKGVELGVETRLFDTVTLFGNCAWLTARFADSDYDGNNLPIAPRQKFTAGFSADIVKGLCLSFDWTDVREFTIVDDLANAYAKESYDVSNLKLGYTHKFEKVSVEGFISVTNLFDKEYSAWPGVDWAGTLVENPAPTRGWMMGFSISF